MKLAVAATCSSRKACFDSVVAGTKACRFRRSPRIKIAPVDQQQILVGCRMASTRPSCSATWTLGRFRRRSHKRGAKSGIVVLAESTRFAVSACCVAVWTPTDLPIARSVHCFTDALHPESAITANDRQYDAAKNRWYWLRTTLRRQIR